MKIKLILSIAALAALTACSDSGIETVASDVTPAPITTPAPAPSPAPVTVCPYNSICAPSPVPSSPIVVTPSPAPVCVRDPSIALVLVDGLLTDNCGNRYGQVTR